MLSEDTQDILREERVHNPRKEVPASHVCDVTDECAFPLHLVFFVDLYPENPTSPASPGTCIACAACGGNRMSDSPRGNAAPTPDQQLSFLLLVHPSLCNHIPPPPQSSLPSPSPSVAHDTRRQLHLNLFAFRDVRLLPTAPTCAIVTRRRSIVKSRHHRGPSVRASLHHHTPRDGRTIAAAQSSKQPPCIRRRRGKRPPRPLRLPRIIHQPLTTALHHIPACLYRRIAIRACRPHPHPPVSLLRHHPLRETGQSQATTTPRARRGRA